MDTSETYIKMCDCEEIQSNVVQYADGHCFVYSVETVRGIKTIWLPRQDQLQEMVYNGFLYSKLEMFYEFAKDYVIEEAHSIGTIQLALTSMEQLWLAFVMKEKYNKVWDGGKWVIGKGCK